MSRDTNRRLLRIFGRLRTLLISVKLRVEDGSRAALLVRRVVRKLARLFSVQRNFRWLVQMCFFVNKLTFIFLCGLAQAGMGISAVFGLAQYYQIKH